MEQTCRWIITFLLVILILIFQCILVIHWIYHGYLKKYLGFIKNNNSDVNLDDISVTKCDGNNDKNMDTKDRVSIDIDGVSKLWVTLSIAGSLVYGLTFGLYTAIIGDFRVSYYKVKLFNDLRNLYMFVIISRYCLYMYYLRRLYVTFQDSIYNISNRKYLVLKVVISTLYVIYILYYIVFEITVGYIINSSHLPVYIVRSRAALSMLYDVIFGISLLVLFTRRLRGLMKVNMNMYNNKEEQHMNKVLKNAVIKTTILATVTVLSTFLFFLSLFLIRDFAFIPSLLDPLINSLCLVLSFNAYKEIYNILCCCNKLCK